MQVGQVQVKEDEIGNLAARDLTASPNEGRLTQGDLTLTVCYMKDGRPVRDALGAGCAG